MLLGKKNSKMNKRIKITPDIQEFLKVIKSDDSFGFGAKQIYCKCKNDTEDYFKCLHWYRQKNMSEAFEKINELYIRSDCNYYITKNSFIANRRRAEYLFSLDNIVIDIDQHEEKYSFAEIDYEINKLLYLLDNDYQGKFPEFNVVYTGRGVQMWIALGTVPVTKYNRLRYEFICKYFCGVLNDIITDNEIELGVDINASCDMSRVLRLPYTFNPKRPDFMTSWEHRTDRRYNFDEILEEFPIDISELKTNKAKRTNKEKKVSESLDSRSGDGRCSGKYKGDTPDKENYIPMAHKRMAFIEQIVADAHGECEGKRNNLIVLYYSSALIVMEREKAKSVTHQLNERFSKPLPRNEIEDKFRYIDKHGRMHFKNATFFEMCAVSMRQRLDYIAQSSKEIERENARQKKKERNILIHTLKAEGMSLRQIASEVGCAVNTVRSVLEKPMPEQEQTSPASEQPTSDTASDVNVTYSVIFKIPALNEQTSRACADNSASSVNVSIDDS